MNPADAAFVLCETASHPLHVGLLSLFEPPPGAGPDHARTMFENLSSQEDASELFRRRPTRPFGVGYPWWSHVDTVDLGYHVLHAAVPRPGGIADLLALASRLHQGSLDPRRPMWQMHVIEGLDDGRIAVYTKIHRSLADGVSALRLLHHTLSADRVVRDCPALWSPGAVSAGPGRDAAFPGSVLGAAVRSASEVAGLMTEVAGLGPAALKIAYRGLREQRFTLPLGAPNTMFNVPVGGARRLATRSWPMDRLWAIAAAAGTTISNVVLALCAGALRGYLLERRALPDASLTAMLPVPLDLGGPVIGPQGRGHGVGAMVVALATDEPDPATRLARIAASAEHTRGVLGALSHTQFLLLSALSISPLALAPVRRFVDHTRPPFNVVISYTPGPARARYWNGARLDAVYPASIVLGGQALSIALTSRAGWLDVGVVGDRKAVPQVQRILTHLETALADLERTDTGTYRSAGGASRFRAE